MSKNYLLSLFAAALLFGTKANAQCGAPPFSSPGSITCYGTTTNVNITLNLLGGPYNIQAMMDYSNPTIPMAPYVTNYVGSSYSIINATAGTYTVYIVDIGHGGCYDSVMYSITQPPILNFAPGFQSPPTCAGLVQASFAMSGGTPPYFIMQSSDSVNYSNIATTSLTTYTTTLALGAYAYKLTDANGCLVDLSSTVFGSAATDQAHWYEGICGVTDSSAEYLTGGNQTTNRNINALLQGLGNFNDVLSLSVNYGDNSPVQHYSTFVKNSSSAIPTTHTYTATGVYKVTYTVIHSPGSSGIYSCWDLNQNGLNDATEDINGDGNFDVIDCANDSVSVVEFINNNADVWPGDANGDGVANNSDLLNVGIAFGSNGVVRSGASNSWTAQACTDWGTSFPTTENYKHADCDGDGTISYSDTTAVVLNYGQSHVFKLSQSAQQNPSDPALTIDFPGGTFSTGTPVTIPITLGTSSVPANGIYGIAFTVNYPTSVIDGNSVGVDFSNCFMGTFGPATIAINKNFAAAGSVDVAISRINQTNTSGFGTLCSLSAITIDNVSGKLNSTISEYFTFSNVTLIDKDGNTIAVNTQKDSVTIAGTTGIKNNAKQSALKLYPNPAKELINLISDVNIEEVQVMDITGRIVMKVLPSSTSVQLSTENMEHGLYIVRIKSANGIEDRRVEVVK